MACRRLFNVPLRRQANT